MKIVFRGALIALTLALIGCASQPRPSFQKKEIAAAWVPEPWGARLGRAANGRIFLDERDLWLDGKFVVAPVIVRTKFLQARPEVVKQFLAAHVELPQRINADPTTAKQKLNSEIARLTGAALPNEILDDAWSRQTVTYDPMSASLFGSAEAAFRLGFLGDTPPNLDNIYALTLLNAILKERGRAGVEQIDLVVRFALALTSNAV